MKYIRKSLVVTILFIGSNLFGQTIDDKRLIEKVVLKALLDSSSPRQCSSADLSISMIVISFNKKGLVEQVEPFDLAVCVDSARFVNQVNEKISTLSINFTEYRNTCIVLPIIFLSIEGKWDASELKEQWLKGLSSENFSVGSKVLKFVIPVTINIYEPQR